MVHGNNAEGQGQNGNFTQGSGIKIILSEYENVYIWHLESVGSKSVNVITRG